MVTLDQFHRLQTPDGQALLAEIAALTPTPDTAIRDGARLRTRWPGDLVAAAMDLWELRQRGRSKFGDLVPPWLTRGGLEQASSPAVARHRAQRFTRCAAVVDACCGIGGDLLALAADDRREIMVAIDRDPLHLAMAEANLRDLGIATPIRYVESDVESFAFPDGAAIFVDPARRSGTGRLRSGDSTPSLDWCLALADGGHPVGIKFAPGIDHNRVPDDWELETIALGFDLKEAALWSPTLAQGSRSATVIDRTGVASLRQIPGDTPMLRTPEVGDVLLDPNPAVTRAGLVADLARSLDTAMIDPQIGFLVTTAEMGTPFARPYRIIASLPWHERKLKRTLRDLDAGPVDIRRRGLAGDVDAIAKRLRGPGHRPFMIAMTRVMNQPWAIVCEGRGTEFLGAYSVLHDD